MSNALSSLSIRVGKEVLRTPCTSSLGRESLALAHTLRSAVTAHYLLTPNTLAWDVLRGTQVAPQTQSAAQLNRPNLRLRVMAAEVDFCLAAQRFFVAQDLRRVPEKSCRNSSL